MCYYYDRPNLLAICLIHEEYAKKRSFRKVTVFSVLRQKVSISLSSFAL